MESTSTGAVSLEISRLDTHEMDGKYLTFWINGQTFGVPIVHVVQIVGMQAITEIPEFPYYAKGVINLRGSIIPLIDVRIRLGKPEADYNERTCVIVTDVHENNVGLIVDEVDAVMNISPELISPPPQLSGSEGGYITGVGKLETRVALLLDPGKIVGNDELQMLTDISL